MYPRPPIYHDRNGIDIPAQFSSHSNLLAIDTQIAIPSIEDYQPNRTNLLVPTCLPISIVFRLLSPLFPSHSAGFLLRYPIIGYLERRSGSTGQPISNSCCRRYLKGKVKKILVSRENMICFRVWSQFNS